MGKILRQNLSRSLTLFYNNLFPYRNSKKSKKKNIVTIGIGGNIGDTTKIFKKLFLMLQHDSRFFIKSTSPILQNPPFGYLEQQDFFNAVVVLQTNLSPFESLRAFQRYENRFKRVRTFQDAPRTLDVDIIFFNNLTIDSKNLTVPHKGHNERVSVLIPLKFVKKK
jgi:2-amino-4-hydroxy-6-hydroxymethyldihydropteridine diphosphokinase